VILKEVKTYVACKQKGHNFDSPLLYQIRKPSQIILPLNFTFSGFSSPFEVFLLDFKAKGKKIATMDKRYFQPSQVSEKQDFPSGIYT